MRKKPKEKLAPVTVRLPETLVEQLSEISAEQDRKLQAIYADVLRCGLEHYTP